MAEYEEEFAGMPALPGAPSLLGAREVSPPRETFRTIRKKIARKKGRRDSGSILNGIQGRLFLVYFLLPLFLLETARSL